MTGFRTICPRKQPYLFVSFQSVFFLQWNTENINYKLDVTNLLVVFISKHQGFYFSMLKKKKNLMWSLHAAAICVWLLRILCDRSLISKRAESWQCSGDVQVDFKADFLLPFSALTRLSLWFVLLKPTVIHTSLSDSVSKKWKQKYNYSLLLSYLGRQTAKMKSRLACTREERYSCFYIRKM